MIQEIVCNDWREFREGLAEAERALGRSGESLWYRGAGNRAHSLSPSLMRLTDGLTNDDHDQFEQDAFFEFQARSAELRRLSLSDWDYLFYARHYGPPTRVLDWTDTIATALYFASEGWRDSSDIDPAIWVINPYTLNAATWAGREIIFPKYLGLDDRSNYWDFGELLAAKGDWAWEGPVSIYPIQINERVRAQRGWFTIHGSNRLPLDEQLPMIPLKLRLKGGCMAEIKAFLELAGLNRFSIYPDLENLALWIQADRVGWAANRRAAYASRAGLHERGATQPPLGGKKQGRA